MASGRSFFKLLTEHIDNTTLNFDINSRAELEQLQNEEGEEGEINWEGFDKLVQRTQAQIEKALKTRKKQRTPVFVYDLQGNYLNAFNSVRECGEAYNITQQHVNVYMKRKMPYYLLNILFREKPLQSVNHAKLKWVYKKKKDTYKLIGVYESAVEASEHINIPSWNINIYTQKGKPYKGFLFRDSAIA